MCPRYPKGDGAIEGGFKMPNVHEEDFTELHKSATQLVYTLDNSVTVFGIVVHTFNRKSGQWERHVFGSDITRIVYISTWKRVKNFLRFLPTQIHWAIKMWMNRNWIKVKRKLYGLFEPSFL